MVFPDAVTARGSKHLKELSAMAGRGNRAVMLYLAQRGDGARLSIAADIDPAYAANLKKAVESGVDVLCYGCTMSVKAIDVADPLPVELCGAIIKP